MLLTAGTWVAEHDGVGLENTLIARHHPRFSPTGEGARADAQPDVYTQAPHVLCERVEDAARKGPVGDVENQPLAIAREVKMEHLQQLGRLTCPPAG